MSRHRCKPLPLQPSSLQRLSGTRLVLRQPLPGDRQAIFRYASCPRASRFMGWPAHHDEEDTRAFLDACLAGWQGEEYLSWVMEREGALAGMIAVHVRGRNAGIGYVLEPGAWGRGYATEALTVVSEALFSHSPVSAIWALCVTANPASARVLEKCGYQRETLLPHYFVCPNLDGQRHDVWRYVRYRHPARTTKVRVKPV